MNSKSESTQQTVEQIMNNFILNIQQTYTKLYNDLQQHHDAIELMYNVMYKTDDMNLKHTYVSSIDDMKELINKKVYAFNAMEDIIKIVKQQFIVADDDPNEIQREIWVLNNDDK